jgi:hypothetical protein
VNHVGSIAAIFVASLVVCVLFIRKFRMKSPTTSTLEFVISEALGLFFVALFYFAFAALYYHQS